MTLTLPVEYEWGHVQARVIHAMADTINDVDRLPEARAAVGSITFTPLVKLQVASQAFVSNSPVTCSLDSNGYLVDAEGEIGVWLITGGYGVSFSLDGGASVASFNISVTTSHTLAEPLQLAAEVPYTPDPAIPINVMVIDASTSAGQVLVKNADNTVSGVNQGDLLGAVLQSPDLSLWDAMIDDLGSVTWVKRT